MNKGRDCNPKLSFLPFRHKRYLLKMKFNGRRVSKQNLERNFEVSVRNNLTMCHSSKKSFSKK